MMHRIRGAQPRNLVVAALVALTVAMYALPLVAVLLGAFRAGAPGQPGEWTFAGFANAFTDARTYTYLGNSLKLAVGMGLAATSLAVLFCWISSRTTALSRRIVTPLMFVVLATPGLFFALSWSLLGAPGSGLLNRMLDSIGLGDSLVDVGGGLGVGFVLSLKVTSLAYFMLLGPFRAMDSRLEEAARISGTSRVRTLFFVTVPVLAPAILGVVIVTMVIGIIAFEMPLIIGLPDGFRVFSTQIYASLNDVVPPDYTTAAALATVLIVAILAMVVLKWRILDRRSWVTVGGKGGAAERWDLGRGNWLCNGFVVLFALLAVVLPGIQLVLGSLQPLFGVSGSYSLNNYMELFSDPFVVPALWLTLRLAVFGGLAAVTLSLALGVIARHAGRAVARALELTTWMPWAVHGVILGLGLTWAFLAVPVLTPLFGTIWILLIGLVIATTPLAARTIDGALVQVSRDLEEAARVSGAKPLRTGVDVVLRLILPSFLAGWLITGIHIAGDLEVPILLATPANRTMSVLVYRFYSDGEASMAAALFCVFLGVAVLLALVAALGIWLGRRLRNRGGPLTAAPPDVAPPTAALTAVGPDEPRRTQPPVKIGDR